MSRLSIIGIAVALVVAHPGPTLALPGDTVATALGVRLDSTLRAAERRGFSGVVRIEKGGELVLAKGYGLANRERRIPFARATVVQIGSNTKDFTQVALLRLQQRGKLSLRDSLGKFFPAAPADKRGITLQQLTEHRGGFPIGLGGDFEAVSRDAFIRAALASQLRAQPGTREIYSNTGYAILAAVIEQVTGTSYDTFIRDDILAPLGLRNTGFLLPQFPADRVAHGYQAGTDRGSILDKPHAADGPYWNLRGNGGMLSTVDDMHDFYEVLFGGERLLPLNARGGNFAPNGPVVLAGSDLVNFFLFERLPGEHVEIIVATNSAESRAPIVREAIGEVLGLPRMRREGGNSVAAAPPPSARPPSSAVAGVVRDFLSTVNAADTAAMRRFIIAHFATEGPSVDERLERFAGMHDRLGTVTPGAMWVDAEGAVNLSITTAKEGVATMLVDIGAEAPHRIRSVRVLVGG
jgi:CubicO group peptidase (beta-lactamase class C family)